MTGFLVRRLLITVVLIWLVTTVVFMFVRLLPGDPASAILGAWSILVANLLAAAVMAAFLWRRHPSLQVRP